MTVKEGQRVGEYTVAKVSPDRITLESPGDSFDILLYDPTKQKKRPVFALHLPRRPLFHRVRPLLRGPSRRPEGRLLWRHLQADPSAGRGQSPDTAGRVPGRNLTRTPVPQRRIPTPPARTQPVPVPDDDDDDDDDDEI